MADPVQQTSESRPTRRWLLAVIPTAVAATILTPTPAFARAASRRRRRRNACRRMNEAERAANAECKRLGVQ